MRTRAPPIVVLLAGPSAPTATLSSYAADARMPMASTCDDRGRTVDRKALIYVRGEERLTLSFSLYYITYVALIIITQWCQRTRGLKGLVMGAAANNIIIHPSPRPPLTGPAMLGIADPNTATIPWWPRHGRAPAGDVTLTWLCSVTRLQLPSPVHTELPSSNCCPLYIYIYTIIEIISSIPLINKMSGKMTQ